MKRTTGDRFRKLFVSALCLLALLWAVLPAQAFTLRKTYDKSNWEEIKEFGPPSLIEWVKKGELVLKTSELGFDWKVQETRFLEATKGNAGRYKMNEEGYTVYRDTGKRPDFIFGFPYPNIDPNAPQAGATIMENNIYLRYRQQAFGATAPVEWK